MSEQQSPQISADELIRSQGLPISGEEALTFSFLGALLRPMTERLYNADLVEEL